MPKPYVHINNNNNNVNLISGVLTEPLDSVSSYAGDRDNSVTFPVTNRGNTSSAYNTYVKSSNTNAHKMSLNYINLEDIDVTGGDINRIQGSKRTDVTIRTVDLDFPFIFPLFLGDLTKHGIEHYNDRRSTDINFYEDSFFAQHNSDAVEMFYDINVGSSDVEKEQVGMLNTNMQYCFMKYDTLHDYFRASNEWYQYSDIINNNIRNNDTYKKHLDQHGSNYAHEFPVFYFEYDGGTYSTLNTLWTSLTADENRILGTGDNYHSTSDDIATTVRSTVAGSNQLHKALDTLLFRYYSNRFDDVINLEISRQGASSNKGDMLGGTRVNFNSIDLHSTIDGSNEYVYASYIANVSIELRNNIVCGKGSYPKLLTETYGLAIEYITKLQAFLYRSEVSFYNYSYIMRSFGFKDLNNLPVLEYNIPMIAKFKVNYSGTGSYKSNNGRNVSLEVVDTAALNHYVINSSDVSGDYYGNGNLTDKQFVKAPFILGEVMYSHNHNGIDVPQLGDEDDEIVSTIPMPYIQHMTSSSVLDMDAGLFMVAFYVSQVQNKFTMSPLGHSITSGKETQVKGNMIAINVYDITQPFSKMAPNSTIIVSDIHNLDSLEFIKHDDKYLLSTLANKTGVVRELTYNGTTWDSTTIIFSEKNIDSLNIAGIKDGELE